MILVIDLGNTRLKAATLKDRIICDEFVINSNFLNEEILLPVLRHLSFSGVVISSVVPAYNLFLKFFFEKHFKITPYFVNHEHVPFKVSSTKPKEEIGADLLASLIGASDLFPDQDLVVIDVGTIITFTILDQKEGFLGAVFYPSANTIMHAMHFCTAQLPIVNLSASTQVSGWGDDTETAILAGVYSGQKGAIKEIITNIELRVKKRVKIIATGGGGAFLKNEYTYCRDLIFNGLYKWWELYGRK